jgi:DNA-binding PadR family transcriptional regulator
MSTTNIFTDYGSTPWAPRGRRGGRRRYFAAMTEESGRPEGADRPDRERPERGDRHEHRGRRAGHGHGGPEGAEFGPEFGAGFGPGGGREGGPGFGRGPGFGPRRGRRRASRGDVRAAVLALLAEEPQHGYAVIGQLAERSGGLWRPSPGSIYPVLAQLEEEGLVTSDTAEGRKVFALTEAGRTYVAEHGDELREPWTPAQTRHRDRAVTLFDAVRSLGSASKEVARNGSDAQVAQARAVLDEARRSLYRILAEEPAEGPDSPDPADPADTADPADPAES